MEIRDPREFLNFFDKVHQRTMKVVRLIPADQVDWTYREDRFTLGELARHIAASNRHIFAETARGGPLSYAGCGKELASSYEEILAYCERMHRQAVEILSALSPDDLAGECTTPGGSRLTTWNGCAQWSSTKFTIAANSTFIYRCSVSPRRRCSD